MNTPKTDAVRLVLHASFPDWREEAMDAIERYDTLSRTLERELSASRAECQRLREALDGVLREIGYCVDDGSLSLSAVNHNAAIIAARKALQEVTP